MREILKYILLLILISLIGDTIAQSIMGGDISYKKASGDSLEITLTLYRDCNKSTISNTPIAITSNTGTRNFTLPLLSKTDITGVNFSKCNVKSKCSQSGSNIIYGIEEYKYRSIVPVEINADCKYIISWSKCCRDSFISTGPAKKGFYINTTYDKCLAPKNSSPTFFCPPKILLPVGQDVNTSLAAFDSVDCDEITYEFVDPLSAKGVRVNYTGSFSFHRPLTFLGFPSLELAYPAGFRLDTLTANLFFRPTVQGQVAVIAIKAKEWRRINGVRTLISETIRDIQLIVIPSRYNKTPRIDGFTTQSTLKSCKAGTFCVDIPVTDADTKDSLVINVKHNFSSLTTTKTVHSPNDVTVKVCYTIDATTFKNYCNRYFKIIATDNACPLVGRAERTYIHLKDSGTTVSLPTKNTFCESDSPFALIANPSYGTWSGIGVTNNTFFPTVAQTGVHLLTYNFEDSITKCEAQEKLQVKIYAQPKASFSTNKTAGLPLDSFKFTNTSIADTTFGSFWNMGQDSATGNKQNMFNANHVYNDTGKFIVSLRVVSSICSPDTVYDTISISLPLSVKKLSNQNIKLYPNPADKIISIETTTEIEAIIIYDIVGRKITDSVKEKGITNTSLNVTHLTSGIYWIKVDLTNGTSIKEKVSIRH